MDENKKTWKQKLSDNAGDIASYGAIAAVILGYIGLVGYAIKKDASLIEEQTQRDHELRMLQAASKSEALERGAKVLPNGDEFWIIEKDGSTSVI